MFSKICMIVGAMAVLSAAHADAQEWQPPARQMPSMPEMAELSGDWLGPRAAWFSGIAALAGVEPTQLRAVGEARRGGTDTQVVRFVNGPVPVVVWQDRNGDSRADLIEIYRSGNVIVQVIDADYDGQANVVRIYDAGGSLAREERL